jgi:hypothetical protein
VALATGDTPSSTAPPTPGGPSPAGAITPRTGGGSGLSALLVTVLLLGLIGAGSTAALVLTRPGRAPRV